MKKILILGGAGVHCKLVNAAKELGHYTIVTDYLKDSPAKKIADESWMINVMDIDLIVEKCKKEGIDGVICGWLDPCQRPYVQICNKLGLPCYATEEQVFNMTDKHAFKKMCVENGVSVIPEYTLDDVEMGTVEYPVFVKPVDSRGSRGQTVCNNNDELRNAIIVAQSESSNGDIIIEKYMVDAREFQVTYFFVDGIPYLIRTVDSYCGSEENHLQKVVACAVSPSQFTDTYISENNDNVVKMFKKLGVKNGPIFMQGFYTSGKFYFFDPGFRFPGVDYELILKKVFSFDLMKAMIDFALTGSLSNLKIPENSVYLNNYRASVIFPTIKAGKIESICGEDYLSNDNDIVSYYKRYNVGEIVEWTYNVNQRLCEVDIVKCDTLSLKRSLKMLQNKLRVYNDKGDDMIFERFDYSQII